MMYNTTTKFLLCSSSSAGSGVKHHGDIKAPSSYFQGTVLLLGLHFEMMVAIIILLVCLVRILAVLRHLLPCSLAAFIF